MRITQYIAGVFAFSLFCISSIGAQSGKQANKQVDTSFANIPWKWRNLGPAHVDGVRVSDIAVPLPKTPKEPRAGYTMYVAGPGGLFKTTTGGRKWEPLGDSVIANAVNRVVVDPTDHNIVWITTGYIDVNGTMIPGRGVFRSPDGGKNWIQMGFGKSEFVGTLAIHPKDHNTVFVSVTGPMGQPSRERGVYKTTDGGKNWTQVLFVNEWAGAVDISIDPSNPNVVYAIIQQRAVSPLLYVDFGPGSGIYKSVDGGATWRKLTKGLPKEWGQGAIAVSPASPNIVYAVLDIRMTEPTPNVPRGTAGAGEGVYLYMSLDSGESWEKGAEDFCWGNSYYPCRVFADPVNPGKVAGASNGLRYSIDTGRTKAGSLAAPDPGALWIDPSNTLHMIWGGDRSLQVTEDGGKTWTRWSNLPMGRYWDIDADSREFFYDIYAVAMDEGGFKIPSRVRNGGSITESDYGAGVCISEIGGVFVDPSDYNRIYSQTKGRSRGIARWNPILKQCSNLGPFAFQVPGEPKKTFDEINGRRPQALVSRHDNSVIYFGAGRVWKGINYGAQWEAVSPEFGKRIPDSATVMGRFEQDWSLVRPGTPRVRYTWGGGQRLVIQALAESPLDPKVLYAGTQSGVLMVTRDGGKNWVKTLPRLGSPAAGIVTSVVASHTGAGVAYTTIHGGDNGDNGAHVYKTMDYGVTWKRISSNLPEGARVWSFAEHFRTPGLLFVGTDNGVYATIDDGAHWAKLRGNVPQGGQVRDLLVQRGANDLVITVWGRGVWVLDDLSPLEHWAQATGSSTPFVFPVRNAMRMVFKGEILTDPGQSRFSADNAPEGAIISYYVPQGYGKRDTIDVMNAGGEIVNMFATDTSPGFHRFVWGLGWAALGGGQYSEIYVPGVRPGMYDVRLRSEKQGIAGATSRFAVFRDPLLKLSEAQEDSIDTHARLARQVFHQFALIPDVGNALYSQLDKAHSMLKSRNTPNDSHVASMAANAAKLRDSVKVLVSGPNARVFPGRLSLPSGSPLVEDVVIGPHRYDVAGANTEPLTLHQLELVNQMLQQADNQRRWIRELIAGQVKGFEAELQRMGIVGVIDTADIIKRLEAPPVPQVTQAAG